MKRASCGVTVVPRSGRSAPTPRRRTSAPPAKPLDQTTIHTYLVELMPQVRYIARRIHSRLPAHVPFDDLLQAGVLGLLDALRKFDPRRKVQIESYMKFRIRGAILDELRSLDWSPRELRRKARQLENAEHLLRTRLGRDPSAAELASELRISIAQYHRLTGEIRGLDVGSLQEPVAPTEEGMEQDLTARLASSEATSPLVICTHQQRRARLEEAIRRLPEKERLALTLYYYEELTMKEVGEVLAVGESRVSQIHSSALVRLRRYLEENGESTLPAKRESSTSLRSPLRAYAESLT